MIKPEGEEHYRKLNEVINGNMDCIEHCQSPPVNPFGSEVVHLDDKFALRLCKLHLWQDFSGYGFNVQGLEGMKMMMMVVMMMMVMMMVMVVMMIIATLAMMMLLDKFLIGPLTLVVITTVPLSVTMVVFVARRYRDCS